MAQLFSLDGSTRFMKRVMFLICGVCWFLFGLGLAFFALAYLAGDAGVQDIGPSLPLFGPAVGVVHLLGIFIVAIFCFIVGLIVCLLGLVPPRDYLEHSC